MLYKLQPTQALTSPVSSTIWVARLCIGICLQLEPCSEGSITLKWQLSDIMS